MTNRLVYLHLRFGALLTLRQAQIESNLNAELLTYAYIARNLLTFFIFIDRERERTDMQKTQ